MRITSIIADALSRFQRPRPGRESELRLRQSERLFRGIADSAPVLLMYSGRDGACRFVNQTWLEFSGRKLGEELDNGWADLIHAEHRERGVVEYREALAAQRIFLTEAPLRRHDGAYRWFSGRGAPRFRSDGRLAGYIGCLLEMADYGDGRGACGRWLTGAPA